MLNTTLNKKLALHILGIIALISLIYWIFSLHPYTLYGLILGVLITTIMILTPAANNMVLDKTLITTLVGTGLIYIFFRDFTFLTTFIVGSNLIFFYLKKYNHNLTPPNINLLNTILLSAIVARSAIEKFRGFNKLDQENIRITIPLVILSTIAIYFLTKGLKEAVPKLQKHLTGYLFTTTTLLSLSLYGISYFIYKEIGTELILIPLICGVGTFLVQGIFYKNYPSITNILLIVLIVIYPYKTSGLLGISLAFLLAYLATILLDNKNSRIHTQNIAKFMPIIFLAAATEVRENEGLITRFNLINGFQMGHILIAILIYQLAASYFSKLKKLLIENEIGKSFPFLATFFTITILTIIIRIGHNEALVGLLISASIFLFVSDFVKSKKFEPILSNIASLSNLIGAIIFLMLTKI